MFVCLMSLYVVVRSSCESQTDCVSCTRSEPERCHWLGATQRCEANENYLLVEDSSNDNTTFADRCPSDVSHHDSIADPFLANWMGRLRETVGAASILDLSLPGSHDTLTYNLSLKISDGGIDNYPDIAAALHEMDKIVPNRISDFIRLQAQTHALNITSQLDNGIRFFDLRLMMEVTDRLDPEWYSLHCLQTYQQALEYLKAINDWLLTHESEIVVLWLSKHGSECSVGDEQFPGKNNEKR